jgi:hypothetical protein
MLKILLGLVLVLSPALPAAAQLHFPEYSDEQVATAANKVCAVLNNGGSYRKSEVMLLIKLRGSLERDLTGIPDNLYSSPEDNEQVIRNANRIVNRLNQTCQAPSIN